MFVNIVSSRNIEYSFTVIPIHLLPCRLLVPGVCHYCLRKSQTLGLSIAVVLEFPRSFGSNPRITNRSLFWYEWTNQRPSLMNIHESPIQTFEASLSRSTASCLDFSQRQTTFSYEWKVKKSDQLKLGSILH